MQLGDLVGGRFKLERRIGAGGMGVVYRAFDNVEGAAVALKLIEGRSAIEIERARREAKALAQLVHPAIVAHVADGVTETGELYLAMEWIEGVTISQRLMAEGLTVRDAVTAMRRIADALAAAHRLGILHRDLKPSNVLLADNDPTGAMLIDFGIARIHNVAEHMTRTGAAVGTPGYMAPEQVRGEKVLTAAADVFGLGCLLYECCTAKPAFSGTAVFAVMSKILFGDPAPLVETCPEVPATLVALVDRMLAKTVEARLADCSAVVTALDALGPIPDGPRRTIRTQVENQLAAAARRAPPAVPQVHCMVGAARGRSEDMLEPPEPAQCDALFDAAAAHGAKLELLATGALVAHVEGEPWKATARAADLALAMRKILPGFSVVVSAVRDELEDAAEAGTSLLTRAAMATILQKPEAGGVTIDPSAAQLLDPGTFELAAIGKATKLVGRKPTGG